MKRMIHKTAVIPAPRADVWQVWTTVEGTQTFFAPHTVLELKPGGQFEVHFFPDALPGQRGAENLRVLSYLPERMFSFEWDAPPRWPEIRVQRTHVVVLFDDADEGTRVDFYHLGWRDGEDWDAVYAYFVDAWDVIMSRLRQRFEEGPIDWDARG